MFLRTVHDWQTPSGYPQVPVRYVVKGQQALDSGSPSPFSRVYEFFGYEAENNIDQSVFEVGIDEVHTPKMSDELVKSLENK